MLVAFCTEGQMDLDAVIKECGGERWIPLLVIKTENKTVLPIFIDSEVCRKFCKRNLPKDWVFGCVDLTYEDVEVLAKKDLEVLEFTYPRLLKDAFDFGIEIHEFVSEIEVKAV